MDKVENVVVRVDLKRGTTSDFDDVLRVYGAKGYRLVAVTTAYETRNIEYENAHSVAGYFLFFTKG